jgi:hypothetical protein
MAQGLLLDPSKRISKSIKSVLKSANIVISEIDSESGLLEWLASRKTDIIYVHIDDQASNNLKHWGEMFAKLEQEGTTIPAVLLVETKKSEGGQVRWNNWYKAIGKTSPIELIPFHFHKQKLDKSTGEELRYRSRRLLDIYDAVFVQDAARIQVVPEQKAVVTKFSKHLLPELHNATSGRLDAERVCQFFGMTLTDLATILDKNIQTVHKTPDAASLQDTLSKFERMAVALKELTGSAENLRNWLNASNPDLEGKSPVSLIKNGRVEMILHLLEDALVGQAS